MREHFTSVLDVSRAWFHVPLTLKTCSLKELTNAPTKEELDKYFQEAQGLLDSEVQHSQLDKGRWYMQQFQSRGTVTDKVASAAVKLSEFDFMFFLDSFSLLFETARTDAHHYEGALKALAAVWPRLLPPRPLKRFTAQHFATLPTDETARRKVLVYWYLEDYLKRTYAQFLALCETMLKDRLLHRREAWLDVCGKLLVSVAEGRSTLIATVVDKMGDPMTSVAHSAYHHILAMLTESSTNQAQLLTELEKIVFMKNCPLRTMRYCVNIMAQLVFSKDERKLALKCVQTYLTLFRELVIEDRIEQSVTTAIITGIRRAFPYAGTDHTPLDPHMNALFVLANTGPYAQRVSTLGLLQQLITKGTSASFSDRWYRALYQCLLVSPKQLPNAGQLSGFFSMLYKALRSDKNLPRVAAFVQRLLQRCMFYSEAFICAVLLLVGELLQTHPTLRTLATQPPKVTGGPYDPKHRDPQYANATSSCVWSLNILSKHSHPFVVQLAVLLLLGEELSLDSHPLDDLTLANFLHMFVDAKQKIDESQTARENKGVPVFRRAVHVPTIPSASDPHFLQASPEHVDVNAIFVHRFAVQRKRFVDGLSKSKSSWGDVREEDEETVAKKLMKPDALFGPEGGVQAKVAKSRKEKETVSDSEEDDEEEGEGGDEFDAHPDDADLSWGSDDDAAYDELEASSGEDEEDEEEKVGRQKRARNAGDVDTQEFEDLIEKQMAAPTKKKIREEKWLDRQIGRAHV